MDKKHLSLEAAVKLFPTPRASDANGAGKHGQGGADLRTAVKLWPTPTTEGMNGGSHARQRLKEAVRTNGMCGGTGNWNRLKEKCRDIDEARAMGAGNGGQLNADWTERLMGFPDGYTDIDRDDIDTANRYPAAWLDDSWDTIPRVVEKQANRRARIKALGNAVVPQITAYLWRLVKGAME
jgi:site-specific DNA-cytosine methylase